MSSHPRLEARVSALERRQVNLETRVEEITEDMTAGFWQLSGDTEANFKQLTEFLIKTQEKNEERFHKIETDIMTIKEQVTDVKSALRQHTALLTQILERLPQKR
jgi:predicted  nucleic acid-binding Zn-ribbon protein